MGIVVVPDGLKAAHSHRQVGLPRDRIDKLFSRASFSNRRWQQWLRHGADLTRTRVGQHITPIVGSDCAAGVAETVQCTLLRSLTAQPIAGGTECASSGVAHSIRKMWGHDCRDRVRVGHNSENE